MSCFNFMKKLPEDNKKTIDDFTISIKKGDLIDNKLKRNTRKIHNNYLYNNLYDNLYNKDECIICLNHTFSKDKLRILKCNHAFHIDCIDSWLTRKLVCPVCMVSIFE